MTKMLNAMKDQRTDIHTLQVADTPRSQIARRLQDAIHELHADVARVELWASALTSFSQPVPDYSPRRRSEFDRARDTEAREPEAGSAKPADEA